LNPSCSGFSKTEVKGSGFAFYLHYLMNNLLWFK